MVEELKKPRPPRDTAPKGGTRFPRYGLKEATSWANRLVSKSHSGPVPAEIVYASVVSSKGSTAEMKVSALKQFGLLEGTSKGYSATKLARVLAIAPPEEAQQHLRQAALTPSVFKSLYETFHGDSVTLGRLRQRAADLKVHPDNLAACATAYADALAFSGLAAFKGDSVIHDSKATVENPPSTAEEDEIAETGSQQDTEDDTRGAASANAPPQETIGSPRAVFHVNVNLDASLDTEKLEKQLGLLKRFGAI